MISARPNWFVKFAYFCQNLKNHQKIQNHRKMPKNPKSNIKKVARIRFSFFHGWYVIYSYSKSTQSVGSRITGFRLLQPWCAPSISLISTYYNILFIDIDYGLSLFGAAPGPAFEGIKGIPISDLSRFETAQPYSPST